MTTFRPLHHRLSQDKRRWSHNTCHMTSRQACTRWFAPHGAAGLHMWLAGRGQGGGGSSLGKGAAHACAGWVGRTQLTLHLNREETF